MMMRCNAGPLCLTQVMSREVDLHLTDLSSCSAGCLTCAGMLLCRQQTIYKVSAIAASLGVTALAIAAVHYRFSWHAREGGAFPTLEACATLLLTIGGVVSTFVCRACSAAAVEPAEDCVDKQIVHVGSKHAWAA